MRPTLLLAWRYLAYHRVRSVILMLGVALVLVLPIATQLLVARYSASLTARAEATPLLLGAPGSRYDLVLDSLYFRGRTPRALSMAEVETVRRDGLALPIPLYTSVSAKGRPLVGTTHEYFRFRGLAPLANGSLPRWSGECVVGAHVASELGLASGDQLLTDRARTYDLSAGYPLLLRVVGVLAPAGSPDDGAVFCDLKTAWIASGIGHGHADAESQDEDAVLARDADGDVILSAKVVEYTEITAENADEFHLHGTSADHPVTGVLVVPASDKARTQLKGRDRVDETTQLLVPTEVMGELFGFVFRVKRYFDANTALVSVATALFLGVIVALVLAVRRRERTTLRKLGCARLTIARLMAVELGLVLVAGAVLASAAAAVLLEASSRMAL